MKKRRKYIELTPIRETVEDYSEIEKRIIRKFLQHLYNPILKELNKGRLLMNAKFIRNALERALISGQVNFHDGQFYGDFNSDISRELRGLGATWNQHTKSYHLDGKYLPPQIRQAAAYGASRFQTKVVQILKNLDKVLSENSLGQVDTKDIFATNIFKVDKDINKTLKAVSLQPPMTKEQRDRVAEEWQNNLNLDIKKFSEKQILELRQKVAALGFQGARRDLLIKEIQVSYGVTERKAKFLAKQETSLMMAKLKEVRYTKAGITHYKWRTVVGSPKHPVRPSHKILENKIFRWDDPPITTPEGEPVRRNNPGQDYNCRCVAIPIIEVS